MTVNKSHVPQWIWCLKHINNRLIDLKTKHSWLKHVWKWTSGWLIFYCTHTPPLERNLETDSPKAQGHPNHLRGTSPSWTCSPFPVASCCLWSSFLSPTDKNNYFKSHRPHLSKYRFVGNQGTLWDWMMAATSSCLTNSECLRSGLLWKRGFVFTGSSGP